MKMLLVLSNGLMATSLVLAQAAIQDTSPTRTRAEVIKELHEARVSGELAAMHSEVGVDGYVVAPPTAANPATALRANPIVSAKSGQ